MPLVAIEVDETEALRQEEEAFRERMRGVMSFLKTEAEDRVRKRGPQEQEWILDVRQFHGFHDPDTARALNDPRRLGKSQLFANKTRDKCQSWIARLFDILFPTEDRNWGISPTPVPRLAKQAEEAGRQAAALSEQAEVDPNAAPAASAAQREADRLQGIIREAEDMAEAMQSEIADQLEESNYAATQRDVIEQMVILGCGVVEGPVVSDKTRRGWKQGADGVYQLQMGGDQRPGVKFTSVWDFFPSSNATSVEDSEGFFIRHVWNSRELRKFARADGVDKDAVRRILKLGSREVIPTHLQQLRSISTSQEVSTSEEAFIVWKYCGPLTSEHMQVLALATDDPELAFQMGEVDELEEINAVVWFCGDEVLQFGLYPYDSGEPMFSVARFERDGSFWGYGIPRIMRDPQKALNAAWRMMMDNSEISSGSQILIDDSKVEPENGSFVFHGQKFWRVKPGHEITGREFATFDIPSHQQELANIIELAYRQIDEVTQLPQIAQGEQGTGVTKTAQGMALLMNSANVIFRRVVKNYDDDMTVPTIRRFYDWNMQFSEREDIKGDYEVAARGSSVLLVREMQAQNLLTIALQFSAHPTFGPMLQDIEVLREVFRAHLLDQTKFVKGDAEYEAFLAQQQEQMAQQAAAAGGDPTMAGELKSMELEANLAQAQMENDTKIQIAEMERETKLMILAEQHNMTLDELESKLQLNREQVRAKERATAAEIAVRSQEKAPLNRTQIANA